MIGGVIAISPSLNVSVFCGSLGLHTQTGHRNFCWATRTNTELKRKGQWLELIPCASFSSNRVLCCFFVSWQRLSARSKSRLRCADLSCRWTRRRWKWYRLSNRAGVKSRRGGRPSKRSSNRWKDRRAPLTQTRFYTDKQQAALQLQPCLVTVQEHHQRKKDKHHWQHAAHVGAVLIQPGGSDPREDRRAGGGEAEDWQTGGCNVAQVSFPVTLHHARLQSWQLRHAESFLDALGQNLGGQTVPNESACVRFNMKLTHIINTHTTSLMKTLSCAHWWKVNDDTRICGRVVTFKIIHRNVDWSSSSMVAPGWSRS